MAAENDNQRGITLKLEKSIAIGVIFIGLSTVGLTWLVIFLAINLNELSFFLIVRTILFTWFLIAVVPVGIFGEYLRVQWKEGEFSWKTATGTMLVFGMFVVTVFLLLTLFDQLLSALDRIWQIPLTGLCSSIGLISVALLLRSECFKKFAEKYLGW
jgi:hypothetical protein